VQHGYHIDSMPTNAPSADMQENHQVVVVPSRKGSRDRSLILTTMRSNEDTAFSLSSKHGGANRLPTPAGDLATIEPG
jgi:hypothetical protein